MCIYCNFLLNNKLDVVGIIYRTIMEARERGKVRHKERRERCVIVGVYYSTPLCLNLQ